MVSSTRMLLARSWWLAVTLVAGCRAGAFACDEPSDCEDASGAGICEAAGWCSFPADDCPSGQRYGEHAGDGLAGECVEVDDGGTTSTATIGESTQTTSVDTTITETSLTTTDATATTEVTQSATTDDPSSEGPTTDDPTTGDPTTGETSSTTDAPPACGDGMIDNAEACDPGAPLPGDCGQHGFIDGMLACARDCQISTAGCGGCGDSCEFPPCLDGCPENEYCAVYNLGEICTAPCTNDADCSTGFDGVACEDGECVLPCMVDDDCPLDIMDCFAHRCAYPP